MAAGAVPEEDRGMELYQLRTFLAVAEEENLTRAAEKLFTSQPAVSAQLKALEEELGVKLFDRVAKGMKLTMPGQALREQARRIVDSARAFKHTAESLRDTVSGELVFGLNNRPEILRIATILGALAHKHPGVTYELVNGSSGVILQGIEGETISVGFFEGACAFPDITWHPLEMVELCLAAPAAWAEELAVPDWERLERKPWIFVSPNCSYYRAIQEICEGQGLQITPRFRVNEDLTVLNLVAEGLGVTLIARSQIEANDFGHKVVPLPHFRASMPLCLGYLTKNADSPAIAAVRDEVLSCWGLPAPGRPAMRGEFPPALESRNPRTQTGRSTRPRS